MSIKKIDQHYKAIEMAYVLAQLKCSMYMPAAFLPD
jgi:hypothetical protein